MKPIVRIASLKDVARFREHLTSLKVEIPCDDKVAVGAESPLRQPLTRGEIKIGNRIAIQPMEGWDGLADGNPSPNTIRRWKHFGASGAKLIWGGEAVAVSHDGRANPNQLMAAAQTEAGLAQLRDTLLAEHRAKFGSDEGLVIGLQLTHSGRYARPNTYSKPEPKILYRHPYLDRRLKLPEEYPVLTDGEIEAIIGNFHRAAAMAQKLGFHFVDIKHCHGYLGHEFLSARTRPGKYGGSFENRTRFLREIVEGIRSIAPGLHIGVRLSAFDTIPFRPDPQQSTNGKLGPGIPEATENGNGYSYGFGVDAANPTDFDLDEPTKFLALLESLGILLVNLTAGSPYYNPHILRPALFPPSDGYMPPEDPLVGVARHMKAARTLKQRFPNLILMGSGYTYLQDFMPNVAQAALRDDWIDCVGVGRMILSYPEFLWDATEGRNIVRKHICRTFSDCTTAPRNGIPSGCYPLDDYYKESEFAARVAEVKKH
jgi:NADPH2 dehydrogenase